jgi:hypothetical protein
VGKQTTMRTRSKDRDLVMTSFMIERKHLTRLKVRAAQRGESLGALLRRAAMSALRVEGRR